MDAAARAASPKAWWAAAVALALALGCASVPGGLEELSAEDQALFQRCREPLSTQACPGEAGDELAACLRGKGAAFAARPSTKRRRAWLELNGCPAALLDAPLAPAAPAPAIVADKALPPPAIVAEKAPPPAAPAPPPAPALLAAAAVCRRSAEC